MSCVKFLAALGLIIASVSAAQVNYGWSEWQTGQPVAVRTLCSIDPANAKHSTISAQVLNVGSDRLWVKGRGTKGDLGDLVGPGGTLDLSFSQSGECSKIPDLSWTAHVSGDYDSGSYRIQYKQGKLQVKYHGGSAMMAIGAALQGVAAGMSGAPAPTPNYPTTASADSPNTGAGSSQPNDSSKPTWEEHNECVKESNGRDSNGLGQFEFRNVCTFTVTVYEYFLQKGETCYRQYFSVLKLGDTSTAESTDRVEVKWHVFSDAITGGVLALDPLPPPGPMCTFF